MLRTFIKLLGITSLGFILASCEEVIDIDLNSENPQVVIEAHLQAESDTFLVFITKTSDYFDATASAYVEGATVVLSDEQGNEAMLTDNGKGVYQTMYKPTEKTRYTLDVSIGNEVYTAESYLPEAVPIMSLETDYLAASGPIDEGYQVYVRFQDDGNADNFYRFKHSINDTLQHAGDNLQVIDDRLFNGGFTRAPLFQQIFDKGDEVMVELVHFDEQSYSYFNSLADIISQGQGPNAGTAAPANPNSNWSNGALGYFSASHSSKKSILIQ